MLMCGNGREPRRGDMRMACRPLKYYERVLVSRSGASDMPAHGALAAPLP